MSDVISLFFWLHLIWKSQGCPRSPLLLNMISEVLAVASRDDKKWKDPSWKEVKLALFADGMILDIEKPKDATRKLLELINKLVNLQDTRLIPSDFLNGIWECICCLLISQKLLLLLFWYFKSNLFLNLSGHPLLPLNSPALDPSHPPFALGCHNDFYFSSIILESIGMPCL